MRKEIRAQQMARLNLDMYSFDLPLVYKRPREGDFGKGIYTAEGAGTFSKDYAGTAPGQRRAAAQSTPMISSASGAGGREGEIPSKALLKSIYTIGVVNSEKFFF